MIPAYPKPSQIRHMPKFLCEDGIYRFPDGREICDLKSKKGADAYHDRKRAMWFRQGKRCVLQITSICKERNGAWPINEITFDHEAGRTRGKQDDRIEVFKDGKMVPQNASVCSWCNCAKGSTRMAYIDAP